MEIKNKLTVTRREEGRRQWGEEGEGSSQGTCVKDPWTKPRSGRRIESGRWKVGRAGESNGENGKNCN